MNLKEFRKWLSRFGARFSLNVALFLVKSSPIFVFRAVMHTFSFIWFHGAKRLRKVARETLEVAFGNTKTPAEYTGIIRQCFSKITYAMMDLAYYTFHPQAVQERFTLEGREYLDAALAHGRGVVLVTAHFGNFPLMLLELAQLGYKPAVIIRRARDLQVAKTIYEIMANVGVQTIYSVPPRESVRKSLEALRDNKILCVLLDQNYGMGSGVFVEFFGRKAATATGPVVLAERTGAQMMLAFTIRDGKNYRVIFEPPFELEAHPDHDEMLLRNVSRITKIIEQYVRRYPDEWGWMHRRWKTQAQGEANREANDA